MIERGRVIGYINATSTVERGLEAGFAVEYG